MIARLVLLLLMLWCLPAGAEQRFPPPDFESGYQLPTASTPLPRGPLEQWLDVGVLLAALGGACWLIHRRRSRRGVMALSLFSLLWFGFYRKGCVCSIGAVQNVALALAAPLHEVNAQTATADLAAQVSALGPYAHYTLPVTVLIFFLAPLIVALFAGRAFCAAVCPQGALQDWILVKPVRVPNWLEEALGLIPYFFLGAGVFFAATGGGFLICRYDPLVPVFRLSGSTLSLVLSAAFLIAGVFIGRPYCRFLCPYGALLRLASALAKWPVKVTPAPCTHCSLCRQACPFGALREPATPASQPKEKAAVRRRFVIAVLLLPLWIAAGALLGFQFFGSAGAWLGGWAGLVIGGKLLSVCLPARRSAFEPTTGSCLACARCFEHCPEGRKA